ncbi:hypothetical protein Tco_0149743 [Tanacetum coccineum]
MDVSRSSIKEFVEMWLWMVEGPVSDRHFRVPSNLLQIETDLLTHDIPGFKTYEECKNMWIHEWNEDMPWVPKEPWLKNGVPYEIVDHFCVPFHEDDELKDEALMKKVEFEES